MNGARAAIQSGASPIPQLERKDVGGRADFQDHAVRSGAVYCTGGDEKVVMLASGPPVYIFLRLKCCTIFLCVTQIADHGLSINTRLQSEVHACVRSRIEQVIAFVL